MRLKIQIYELNSFSDHFHWKFTFWVWKTHSQSLPLKIHLHESDTLSNQFHWKSTFMSQDTLSYHCGKYRECIFFTNDKFLMLVWDVALDFVVIDEISDDTCSLVIVDVIDFHHLQCSCELFYWQLMCVHENVYFLE